MGGENKNGPRARAECIGKHRNQSDCNDAIDESQPINPANLHAERSVLGGSIENDSFVPKVLASGLRCEHFFLSAHRRIFEAIEVLYKRNVPVDYVSISEQLGNRSEDYAAIADLVHGVVLHKDHILHHAHIVRKKACLRTLLRIGEWISKAIVETDDPDVLISQVRNMLDECTTVTSAHEKP